MCICDGSTGGTDIFHTACGACHGSCETCGRSNDEFYCESCVLGGTVLNPYDGSRTCECGPGYVPEMAPTSGCKPCAPAGCPNCIGSDEAQCMSPEMGEFIKSNVYPPITTETDNRICYRTALPTSGCTPDPIETVTGPIENYATEAKPSTLQCYRLLKAEWPWLTHWFNKLFPSFTGPKPSNYFSRTIVKTVLHQWILQFGPTEMNTWTDFKEAMNGAGENWKNYFAWLEGTPGFSLNAGLTEKAFPAGLLTWLQSSCTDTTNCMELYYLINSCSTVCDNSQCSSKVKDFCTLNYDWTDCAKAS